MTIEIAVSVGSTCVYGELELFLSGLDLGVLISTFQHHEVNFSQFLRMTDKDLQQVCDVLPNPLPHFSSHIHLTIHHNIAVCLQ